MSNFSVHRVVGITVSKARPNGSSGYDQEIVITTEDGTADRVILFADWAGSLLPAGHFGE